MELIKAFLEYATLVSRKFYSVFGLVVTILLSLVICTYVVSPVLGLLEDLKSKPAYLSEAYITLVFRGLVTGVVILVWALKRKIPKFAIDRIGVLFGPNCQDMIRCELSDLEDRVQDEIAGKDLKNVIEIKRLPPNHKVGDHDINMKVLRRANGRVLICGRFEEVTEKGKIVTGFSTLTVTAYSLPLPEMQASNALNDAISERQLVWDSENTIEKNIVAENLSEIARYIVGLCLITELRHEEALLTLGPLLKDVKSKYCQKRISIKVRRFVNTIEKAYVFSLGASVNYEYSERLLSESLFTTETAVLESWQSRVNEALKTDEHQPATLLQLSIILFLLKDVDNAKEFVRKAWQIAPTNKQYICELSEAFLLCFEGKLNESKRLYKKIAQGNTVPDILLMQNVFSFLDQAIRANPDKPQIRFAYAFLNDEFGDRRLAMQEFSQFVDATSDQGIFARWRREAKLRTVRINQELAEVKKA